MLDPATRHGAALLDQMINQQAQIIAYNNDFRLMTLTMVPPLLLLCSCAGTRGRWRRSNWRRNVVVVRSIHLSRSLPRETAITNRDQAGYEIRMPPA